MPELMGLGDTILSSLLPFAGWLDGQNAIRVGLFMLLISLLVSCRRNSGLPSFIVSGACVSLSGAWWAIRVLLGGRFGECICATPMMLLIMASWFTFLDTVLPFDRSKALRRHMMVILGLVIMESFTIAVTDISDSGWEGSDQNLAVAAIGFATVHLLCSYGLCKETAKEPPQETQPSDKSVQLV